MYFDFCLLRCGSKLWKKTEPLLGVFMPRCLWLLALLAAFPLHATTYYVATNGNNSYDGLAPTYDGTHGPFANFKNINYGGSHALQPGDILFVEGGTYCHTNDSTSTGLRIFSVRGTQASPVIISNYPGQYPVIYGSGPNNYAIDVRYSSWVKLFGINETNAYRGANFDRDINCEIAYCNFGGGDTNIGYLQPFTMDNNSQSNWVHNCTVHDALARPVGDSTHCMTFGLFYSTNDFTSYNIIESNTCYHAGHDVLSIYGPDNLIRGNFIHNEAWYWRADFQTNGGHRCVEIGGRLGYGNVFENNRAQYAGLNANGGSHGLELDGPGTSIIRGNVFCDNTYSGLTIYGGKVGSSLYWGSNYVYNNTFALNGFGPSNVVLYRKNSSGKWVPYGTNNETVWKPAVTIANSKNNFFVNNLLVGNYADTIANVGQSGGVADSRNNSVLSMADAKFVNTTDGGPWSQTLPDFALMPSSPAVDQGTFLTTITSASGSGTSFTVANAGWFFAGMTAAGHTVPGDSIQFQGQTDTASITAISGNTISVDKPMTWTKGQGVALPYSGKAPDVGAFEDPPETSLVAPPSNLRIISNRLQ